jgi:HTH-type transcriptional regulator/antitoxin HipB
MLNKEKLDLNILQSYSLDEIEDKYIGVKGTPERDIYEFELQLDLLGETIKKIRKSRNLTQEQLGQQIGVDKSQISKLEKNASNVTIMTVLKVFNALKAKVNLRVELGSGNNLSL